MYYYNTLGDSPVNDSFFAKDGNIYSFSNGVRSLVQACSVTPLSTDMVWTIDTRKTGGTFSNQFKISFFGSARGNYTVFWGDGTSSNHRGTSVHTYNTAGVYTLIIRGDVDKMQFSAFASDAKKLLSVEQWGNYTPKVPGAFLGCENLELSNVSDVLVFDTTIITGMFYNCKSLTTINNVGQWDVSAIEVALQAFQNCININIDLSGWDVSNVKVCSDFSDNTPKWTLPKPNFTRCNPN